MRKPGIIRFDLNMVYFVSEYNAAVAHGQQNIRIQGVKEYLQGLEQEKNNYFDKVANIVNPERETEQTKYQQYEKWATYERNIKWLEILLILANVLREVLFKYLPIGFRTSWIFSLFSILLMWLVILAGPLAFLASKGVKHIYAIRYNRYIEEIANQLNSLGSDFERISLGYYDAIDNLYLGSLDPAHREMILLRRQQEIQHQEMLALERERQMTEAQRLAEQQRTRQATEELLHIEKERERRYRRY